MNALTEKKCRVCEGGVPALSLAEAQQQQKLVPEWIIAENGKTITKTFNFKGFYKTMAFVNAVAWIANNEGHHPDMEVTYNRCIIHFTTHAIDGLTENDFICAAKVDQLML